MKQEQQQQQKFLSSELEEWMGDGGSLFRIMKSAVVAAAAEGVWEAEMNASTSQWRKRDVIYVRRT
jgi:hypothetical protein